MNKAAGSIVHWHVTVVLDWKMAIVISISALILLRK